MAASTGTSSRTTLKFGKCPSCQQDVEDVVHVEVTVGRVEIVQDSSNRNRATALIVGVTVEHDCSRGEADRG